MTVSDNAIKELKLLLLMVFAKEMKIGKKKLIEILILNVLLINSLIQIKRLLNFLVIITQLLVFVPINKFNLLLFIMEI